MHKTTARMPGSPGPQPRDGISPHAQRRIAQLEAAPGKFLHNEAVFEATSEGLDNLMQEMDKREAVEEVAQ